MFLPAVVTAHSSLRLSLVSMLGFASLVGTLRAFGSRFRHMG
jgi:hypothetical protein